MAKMNGDWIKPRAVGAVFGAVAMTVAGFWGLGWTTAGTAEQRARVQSETAVVNAMVPYCVASARRDPDGAKLTKLGTETSSWTRAQFVRDAGCHDAGECQDSCRPAFVTRVALSTSGFWHVRQA